ncbi:MAG: hypothetical protein JO345_08745 [Streptosporangiaceae bacterium]|nr:hypothetical protein [Streptosporangiaceae bacterium]
MPTVTPAARHRRRVVLSGTTAVVLAVLALASGCAGNPQPKASRPGASQPPASKTAGSKATSRPASRDVRTLPSATARPGPVRIGTSGTYQVGQRQMTFSEPAHRGATGVYLGSRGLVTEIMYPLAHGSGSATVRGPLPLLLFAPGYLQCVYEYSDLLRSWASAGYVVAAVSFPVTSCQAGGSEADLVNQPQDMSYLLSKLLRLSAQPGDSLSGLLDSSKVAAAGQSDGGDTVAALAASTCCTDHRLKAVAVLSGAEWPAMPGRYFAHAAPPMLFTQGSADTVNPPWTSQQLYRADRGQERYYLDLFGASHLPPYEGSAPVEHIVARVTLAFFDRYVLGQSGAAKTMAEDGNVAGVAALVGSGTPPP